MSDAPSDKVYNYVMNNIRSSEWTPDTKIMSENEMSEALSVSRVAVRQAFEKLDALGLITKKRGSGTYINSFDDVKHFGSKTPVLTIDDEDMLSLLNFRKFFEYGSIHLFVDRCTEAELGQLEEKVILMNDTDDPVVFSEADFEFHSIIAYGTHNPIVVKVNEIMMDIFEGHQLLLNKRIGPGIGLEYHDLILKAIMAKDSELASILMLRHIEAAINEFERTSKVI